MRNLTIILLAILLVSCTKEHVKICPEGEVVFNTHYCVNTKDVMASYVGYLNFYCQYDSIYFAIPFNNSSFKLYGQGGSSLTGGQLYKGRYYFDLDCTSNDKVINNHISEKTVLAVPSGTFDGDLKDSYTFKMYQVNSESYYNAPLDSTQVTLSRQ